MRLFPSILISLLLSSCASLGIAPAQTFNQKVAYAIGIHTAVEQTIAASATSGALSSTDNQKLETQSENARTIIDAAVAANSMGDIATANSKLALATTALTALQTYLNTHTGAQ